MIYIGKSGGSFSATAKRIGEETAELKQDAQNSPDNWNFRFTSHTYARGAKSRGGDYVDNIDYLVEQVFIIQFYSSAITDHQIQAQEMRFIEKIKSNLPVDFLSLNNEEVSLRLREAFYELEPEVDPNWFPPNAVFVVCNYNNLPPNLSHQLSPELAQELIEASPEQIQNLTTEKILRIYRGEVDTLAELLA